MNGPTHAVDKALANLGINRSELARRLGVTPQALSRTLKVEELLSQRSLWPAILEALGLEVIVQPKQQRSRS